MYYLIYKVTNQIDGKFYIGSHKTKNLDDNYMGSGKYLKRAQEKYGLENFTKEILFVFDNPEEMYSKESEIVTEDFLATENTYNLKIGGFGGWDYINSKEDNKTHSQEHMHKMLVKRSEKWSNPDHLQKVIQKRKDTIKLKYETDVEFRERCFRKMEKVREKSPRNHTEETRHKMKISMQGKQSGSKNSQYGLMWITNGVENKKIKRDDIIPEKWYKGRKVI